MSIIREGILKRLFDNKVFAVLPTVLENKAVTEENYFVLTENTKTIMNSVKINI